MESDQQAAQRIVTERAATEPAPAIGFTKYEENFWDKCFIAAAECGADAEAASKYAIRCVIVRRATFAAATNASRKKLEEIGLTHAGEDSDEMRKRLAASGLVAPPGLSKVQ